MKYLLLFAFLLASCSYNPPDEIVTNSDRVHISMLVVGRQVQIGYTGWNGQLVKKTTTSNVGGSQISDSTNTEYFEFYFVNTFLWANPGNTTEPATDEIRLTLKVKTPEKDYLIYREGDYKRLDTIRFSFPIYYQ